LSAKAGQNTIDEVEGYGLTDLMAPIRRFYVKAENLLRG
jgi:hypothetical protein